MRQAFVIQSKGFAKNNAEFLRCSLTDLHANRPEFGRNFCENLAEDKGSAGHDPADPSRVVIVT